MPSMLRPTHSSDRVSHEREAVHSVLDEALVCHVGLVVHGQPHVLPTMHVRADDLVYVHASSAARLAILARSAPIRMCMTVSLLDGVVLARSAFHHSLNYRSVVIHADARLVRDDEEKTRALAMLVDRVGAGRSDQCRHDHDPASRRLANVFTKEELIHLAAMSPRRTGSSPTIPSHHSRATHRGEGPTNPAEHAFEAGRGSIISILIWHRSWSVAASRPGGR